MSELGLFMLPSEIEWLNRVISDCEVYSYICIEKDRDYHCSRAEMREARSFQERRFYLSSNNQDQFVISQTRPLINVFLPMIEGRNLCMATIGISRPWDEALSDIYKTNLPIYRRLVRKIRKDCQLGMFATNVNTKGRSWYPQIAVTSGVVANISSFAALKPVLCDTFIEFTLLEHDPEQ